MSVILLRNEDCPYSRRAGAIALLQAGREGKFVNGSGRHRVRHKVRRRVRHSGRHRVRRKVRHKVQHKVRHKVRHRVRRKIRRSGRRRARRKIRRRVRHKIRCRCTDEPGPQALGHPGTGRRDTQPAAPKASPRWPGTVRLPVAEAHFENWSCMKPPVILSIMEIALFRNSIPIYGLHSALVTDPNAHLLGLCPERTPVARSSSERPAFLPLLY